MFRPRGLIRTLLVAAMAGGLAAACATVPKLDAAADIHTFLIAVRDGDRATFDAHVDREALKSQLRSRVAAEAGRAGPNGGSSLQALGAFLLSGPLVDVAVDALLRPEVFRAVAEMRGYSSSTRIPGSFAIAHFVKPLGSGLVCVILKENGPCVLDFRNEDGVWRLTGFEGDMSLLRPRPRS